MIYPNISWPVDEMYMDSISSRYGERIHPKTKEKKFHYGIDFAIPVGSNIYSVSKAKCVLKRVDKEGFGKWLLLHSRFDHLPDKDWFFFYTHLSDFNCNVGDDVFKGQAIGLSGDTGTSTGPHLHFQVCKNSAKKEDYHINCVDPEKFYSVNENLDNVAFFVKKGVFPDYAIDQRKLSINWEELSSVLSALGIS